jgi:hypothetical protein
VTPSAGDAPPPWTCRLTAVVRLGLDGRRPTALAVVAYAGTPVGPYGEALLTELRLPLRVTVPWIVVDSAASVAAGRAHWGLPKTEAVLQLELSLDRRLQRATVGALPDGLRLRARAFGPRLPVVAAAVLAQPGRGPAPLRFRGRGRAALVRVAGGPSAGSGPGAVLDGVLRLAAPRRDPAGRVPPSSA